LGALARELGHTGYVTAHCQELKEPVVPNFRALPPVRILTAGGSSARRTAWMAACCGTAPRPAPLRDAIRL